MATRVPKPIDEPDFIPEGPELDALIKARVAQVDSIAAPGISTTEVFEGLCARHLERMMHGN
jgi:hypothetical protein